MRYIALIFLVGLIVSASGAERLSYRSESKIFDRYGITTEAKYKINKYIDGNDTLLFIEERPSDKRQVIATIIHRDKKYYGSYLERKDGSYENTYFVSDEPEIDMIATLKRAEERQEELESDFDSNYVDRYELGDTIKYVRQYRGGMDIEDFIFHGVNLTEYNLRIEYINERQPKFTRIRFSDFEITETEKGLDEIKDSILNNNQYFLKYETLDQMEGAVKYEED
ncbi:MAG: hypothetical protein Kapaf2KO_03800 [Candidatus Kapaibacteriales bacterium]